MSQHLQNKVAVITGSTSGIGLGMAKELAQAGATIVLNGLGSEEQIQQAIDEVSALSMTSAVSYVGADMRDGMAIEVMMQEIEAAHGSIDILINNAGTQHVDRIEDFPPEKWEDIIAINLSSAFYTSASALPGMIKRNYGRIINVASAHGLVASAKKSAYVAAKHGLIGFTKVTALENAERNITCNTICPGWVLTPLVQAQIDKRASSESISMEQAGRDLLSEKMPTVRFTTVEQLAGAVSFLCSSAADNMTGSNLVIDGGWTAQ